ncbi:MAG: cupin domain-containing protein [Sphingomonadales bacterium]|nr:cupin domain-containing protein [Sphingomonadales bacterium]
MEWYGDYVGRHQTDGREGRLVTVHSFSESWDSWEVHPEGDEVVLCLSGTITLHQELADGENRTVVLESGDYAINPPGAWHTADVTDKVEVLFITAGWGTQHRPREMPFVPLNERPQ